MVPGPDYTEDDRIYPIGIAHAARLMSAGQYADEHCRGTEQFNSRACLFGKITQDLIVLQRKNTPRTSQSGLLIVTAMATAISALIT